MTQIKTNSELTSITEILLTSSQEVDRDNGTESINYSIIREFFENKGDSFFKDYLKVGTYANTSDFNIRIPITPELCEKLGHELIKVSEILKPAFK